MWCSLVFEVEVEREYFGENDGHWRGDSHYRLELGDMLEAYNCDYCCHTQDFAGVMNDLLGARWVLEREKYDLELRNMLAFVLSIPLFAR